MGSSGLVSEEDNSKVEHTSLTETFEELCPIYMSYGMSYNEFWHGDAYIVMFYRKSHKLKLKERDENNWLMGMYVYDAIGKLAPILHPFSKKGTKPLPYAEQPFLYDKLLEDVKTEEQKQQEEEQRVEAETLKAQIQFNNWFRATKKMFENKQN